MDRCSLEPYVYGTCAGFLVVVCGVATTLLLRICRRGAMTTPETAQLCLDGLNISDDEKLSSLTPCTPSLKSWFKSLEDIQFDVDSSPDSSPVQHETGTDKQPLIRPARLTVPSFSVSMATANMNLSDGQSCCNRKNGQISNTNPFSILHNPSVIEKSTVNPLDTFPQDHGVKKTAVAPSNGGGGSQQRTRSWNVLLVAVVTASLFCNLALLSVLGVNLYNTYR